MDTPSTFSSPGEPSGNIAGLSWAVPPYDGHRFTRVGRGLSMDQGVARTRVRLFVDPDARLVIRVVGHRQATVQRGSAVNDTVNVNNTRIITVSDAEGCVVTLASNKEPETRWERITFRWHDGDTHAVASPAVRDAESAGRARHERPDRGDRRASFC